ncbi:MAG TPA: MBL fold metallo-hydrolase [Thermomicrobiales bacterium]|nr:MBL fold metallo-hydrolase [Thermomicrobiales bacterium]
MRLYSLGSGSSGNAFVLVTDAVSLFIDCGVAMRTCRSALRDLGALHPVAGIVVSHEHSDHIRAIPSVLRWTDCPVVTTPGTYAGLRSNARWSQRRSGERYAEGPVEVTFIGVSHDAAEPCGFVIDADGTRVAVFTDLGVASEAVLDAMRGADIVVLESNYDSGMLRSGHYPARLKRRIQGPLGHLSNDDCATALVATVSDRTRSIWLAHLSHNNNHADIALAGAQEALRLAGLGTPVQALPRYETIEITGQGTRQTSLGL